MSVLDDFFGDEGKVCAYCGEGESLERGALVVSVTDDVTGEPTRWVHRSCEAADDAMRASAAARALGHLGGSRTSQAKRAAARANGRKGGRPRKSDK